MSKYEQIFFQVGFPEAVRKLGRGAKVFMHRSNMFYPVFREIAPVLTSYNDTYSILVLA